MLKLNFKNEVSEVRDFDNGIFEKLMTRIEKVFPGKSGEIALVIVGDEKIRELNRDYRNKDKATDVLSFGYNEDPPTENPSSEPSDFGDIFISLETAKKQAQEKGHSLEKELQILFVHGVLHLFGFDHNNDEEEEEMEGYAGRILGE